MNKALFLVFLLGVLIAIGLAAWQYTLTPQGLLFYTPAANETNPHYVAASAVGFSAGMLVLSVLCALAALVSAGVSFVRRSWPLSIAGKAVALSISFGTLCYLAARTEAWWP